MNKTKIEWCRNPDGSDGHSWNPVTGCLHGCAYCYARRIAERFSDEGSDEPASRIHETNGIRYNDDNYPIGFPYGFEPTLHRHRLDEPKSRRKPSRIFVSSMGDLFGEWVPAGWIEAVLRTVRECPQHTFIFLTKNPKGYQGHDYPPNAWIGVTCEDQQAANERIPLLLATPAAVRFVSVEPMLGPVDLCTAAPCGECGEPDDDGVYNGCRGGEDCLDESWWWSSGIHWVIVGQQTGPGATPPERVWVQEIADACRHMRVPLFLKDNLRWPERIQGFPQGGDSA